MQHIHGLSPLKLLTLTAGLTLVIACGTPPEAAAPADDPDTAASSSGADGTISNDGGAGDSATAETSSSGGADAESDTGATDEDGAPADTGGGDTAAGDTAGSDAETGDTTADPDTTTAVDAGPKLPLPDCAKGTVNCDNCPETPMCLDGKTYKNDCEAILALKAYAWPQGYSPTQGKCPDCKDCIGVALKCNTQKKECEECDSKGCTSNGETCAKNEDCKWTPVCATLKSGAKLTVEVPCEAQCLDLAENVGINPKNGACKSKCSAPPPDGGGCAMNVWQPVCSKKDGKTYASECAMQNCDLLGCHGAGEDKASAECAAGKMELECPGECWDSTNSVWSKAGCTSDCKPVCGIAKNQKGVTYRNKCIAAAEGANATSCDGVSTTKNDKCSAQLYVDNAAPCCKDVQYELVKPACASFGSGPDAEWYTFRSKAEFTCWDDKAKAKKKDDATATQWEFKYQGACICKCPKTDKPVCGADGWTYQNACQAKCYNGDQFTWKTGACS